MNHVVNAVKQHLDLGSTQPIKSSVYQAFRRTIILGDIPAGERINESLFAEELNISRTPIRYALNLLLKEELVEHIPGIGTVVKGISIKDAYEIYEIRKSLDTLAFTKAMKLMTAIEFDELEHLLLTGNEIYTANRINDLVKNFSDFNAYVYAKSRMCRLPKIINELQAYLVYFRELSIQSNKRNKIALEEHFMILRGMRNQDEHTVELLIHDHLDRSLTFIIKEMENRNIG